MTRSIPDPPKLRWAVVAGVAGGTFGFAVYEIAKLLI